jgi:hypothetical protein
MSALQRSWTPAHHRSECHMVCKKHGVRHSPASKASLAHQGCRERVQAASSGDFGDGGLTVFC